MGAQLCQATAPVLAEIAQLLLSEDRAEVLISLSRAATHFVAQEGNLSLTGMRPAWVCEAAELLHQAAEALPQRSVCNPRRAADGLDNSEDERSESSSSASTSED